MLRAGHNHRKPHIEYGLYLADEEQNSSAAQPLHLADRQVGDRKEVFLYHDSEDRLAWPTETPLLRAERQASCAWWTRRPTELSSTGDSTARTFLPNRNQQGGILAGHSYVVYLYEDSITGRCVATTNSRLHQQRSDLGETPRGSFAVASKGDRLPRDRQQPPLGMIYRNQIFRPGGRRRPPDGPSAASPTTASTCFQQAGSRR